MPVEAHARRGAATGAHGAALPHELDLPAAVADDLGFLLARTSGVVVRAANAALAPYDLRPRQLAILKMVVDRPYSQRDLSAILGLDPSNVVALIDDLERTSLVKRTPDPNDRRARLVRPTKAGTQLVDEVARVADEAVVEALGYLNKADRDNLRALLRAAVSAHL